MVAVLTPAVPVEEPIRVADLAETAFGTCLDNPLAYLLAARDDDPRLAPEKS